MSGDLYHYPEEITYKRVPSFDSDKEQTAQSRAMIEEFVRRTTANHGSRTIKPLGSTPWRAKSAPDKSSLKKSNRCIDAIYRVL